MKLILNNHDTFTITDGSTPTSITARFQNVTDMDNFRQKLTTENLSRFTFAKDSFDVIGVYENYEMPKDGHVSYRYIEEMYEATFPIAPISETELRLRKIEAGQEIQDGAITELAELAGGE